jgi:hypothetical protein
MVRSLAADLNELFGLPPHDPLTILIGRSEGSKLNARGRSLFKLSAGQAFPA